MVNHFMLTTIQLEIDTIQAIHAFHRQDAGVSGRLPESLALTY